MMIVPFSCLLSSLKKSYGQNIFHTCHTSSNFLVIAFLREECTLWTYFIHRTPFTSHLFRLTNRSRFITINTSGYWCQSHSSFLKKKQVGVTCKSTVIMYVPFWSCAQFFFKITPPQPLLLILTHTHFATCYYTRRDLPSHSNANSSQTWSAIWRCHRITKQQ